MNACPVLTRSRRAMTLLEVMIFSSILALTAVSTLRVMGDARVVRGNARDRSTMALIAQSEIERVRSLPADRLVAGSQAKRDPSWPEGVAATLTTTPRPDGTWLVDVRVARESLEGKAPVRLTTVVAGGTP